MLLCHPKLLLSLFSKKSTICSGTPSSQTRHGITAFCRASRVAEMHRAWFLINKVHYISRPTLMYTRRSSRPLSITDQASPLCRNKSRITSSTQLDRRMLITLSCVAQEIVKSSNFKSPPEGMLQWPLWPPGRTPSCSIRLVVHVTCVTAV